MMTMDKGQESHEQMRDLVAAYVLDAVTPNESDRAGEHLRICALCRELANELREVKDVLPHLIKESAPPSALKERIMTIVSGEAAGAATPERHHLERDNRERPHLEILPGGAPPTRATWSWLRLPLALTAAAAVVVAVMGVGLQHLFNENGQPTRIYSMAPINTSMTNGTLAYYRNGERLSLTLHGLRPVDQAHVYELWLIRGKTLVKGAGVFRPDANGTAHYMVGGENVPSYTVAALTIERTPSSRTPTTPMIAAARLGA